MRITLILGVHEAAALQRIAAREDRPTRDQAARLLRESLVRAGDLVDEFRPSDQPVYCSCGLLDVIRDYGRAALAARGD